MRKIIEFICFLPHGIHMHQAVYLEKVCRFYQSDIHFINLTNKREGSAKSILNLISSETVLNDTCRLVIEGVDADSAFERLSSYIHDEFSNYDEIIVDIENETLCLPPSLLRLAPNLLRGRGNGEGFAKGQLVSFESRSLSSFLNAITSYEFDAVREELLLVLMKKVQDVCEVKKKLFETQIAILHDPVFIEPIKERQAKKETLAQAIIFTVEAICERLAKSDSNYLKERVVDFKDVGLQLLEAAHPTFFLADIKQLDCDSIVFANRLSPSELLRLERTFLKGLILANSSEGSHTLMLAKALAIPVVTEIDNNSALIEGEFALLDARLGFVIPAPSLSAVNYVERAIWPKDLNEFDQEIAPLCLPLSNISTLDEKEIEILAISSTVAEAKKAFENGIKAIGLFPTDSFFVNRAESPTEAWQYEIYRHLVKVAKGRAITVSTLSLGFDKSIKYLNLLPETNPLLGFKGVRIYPQFLFLLHTQLRALLRAAHFGKVKILIPMLQSIEEIRWFKQQVLTVMDHLKVEEGNYGELELGILIELPAAAFMMDLFCQEVDFFTINADSLVQYFHGADKENTKVCALANILSPAFLRLVSKLVLAAHLKGKKISWCGALLEDQAALPLLVGAGLESFTLATAEIKGAKEALDRLDSRHCNALFEKAKNLATFDEVLCLLTAFLDQQKQKRLFEPDCVLLDRHFLGKEEAIQALVTNLSLKGRTLAPVQLEADIWANEDVSGAHLGKGFALSFVKSSHLLHSSASIVRLIEPIIWDETTKESVNFIIILVIKNAAKNEQSQSEEAGLYNEQSDFYVTLVRKLTHEKVRNTLNLIGSEKEMISYLVNELGL